MQRQQKSPVGGIGSESLKRNSFHRRIGGCGGDGNGECNPQLSLGDALGARVVLPAHDKCHKRQTAKFDLPAIAKSKRVIEKHLGIKPKGWGSKYRRKVSGEVVRKVTT